MRERDEQALELRRRDVDPALEQVAEERAVALRVAALRVREAADRLVGAEERRHRADALHAAERAQARPRAARRFASSSLVDGRVAQPPQHREPGRGRERVPGQRARLVDVAGRREPVHHLGAAAERRERQAAADDLAEDRQVGQDAEALLRAAARDAEAGDHLVEDEQRAARRRRAPQRLEEARRRRDDAHVPGDRLDEDRRQPLAVALDRRGGGVDVVVGRDDRVGGDAASARPGSTGSRASRARSPRSASSASAWPW